MAAIIATLATIFGLGAILSARNFVQLGIGIILLGVGIYLLGYSPWL
jgi:glucose uptake protein GlcU